MKKEKDPRIKGQTPGSTTPRANSGGMAFAEWLPAVAGAKARRAVAAASGGQRAPCRGALNDASRDPVRGSRAVPPRLKALLLTPNRN